MIAVYGPEENCPRKQRSVGGVCPGVVLFMVRLISGEGATFAQRPVVAGGTPGP